MTSPKTAAGTCSDVYFEAASPEDDAAIRRLLRRTPMPGDVTIGYHREPSFFRSLLPMGNRTQVAVGRPADNPDRVVALGCRTIRELFVEGTPQRVGYLSQMRVDPEYRGRGLVDQGFRKIREWHEDDPTPYSYATITDENPAARKRLVGRSDGAIPPFRPLADLHTLAIVLRSRRLWRPTPPDDLTVNRAPTDLRAVAAFLRDAGRDRVDDEYDHRERDQRQREPRGERPRGGSGLDPGVDRPGRVVDEQAEHQRPDEPEQDRHDDRGEDGGEQPPVEPRTTGVEGDS